jgi:hypothetical protein
MRYYIKRGASWRVSVGRVPGDPCGGLNLNQVPNSCRRSQVRDARSLIAELRIRLTLFYIQTECGRVAFIMLFEPICPATTSSLTFGAQAQRTLFAFCPSFHGLVPRARMHLHSEQANGRKQAFHNARPLFEQKNRLRESSRNKFFRLDTKVMKNNYILPPKFAFFEN